MKYKVAATTHYVVAATYLLCIIRLIALNNRYVVIGEVGRGFQSPFIST